MLKKILSLLLVIFTVYSMSSHSASANVKKKKKAKAKITQSMKLKKKSSKTNKVTHKVAVTVPDSHSKITLNIRPVPKSELDSDLLVEFTVTNSQIHELPHTHFPRTCVLNLPILAQSPKFYLGKTSVFVQQTDLKEYGLSSSDQSVAIRLADNQDIKTVISLWTDQSQGISFSELDNQDMGKFIDELTGQLKTHCGQSSVALIHEI